MCMTPPLNREQQEHFNEALVLEIKAEMGRRGLSSRALGRLIGESSQYMSMRFDGGNPKTGKRVPLSIPDAASIASVFDMEVEELLARATASLSDLSTTTDLATAADEDVSIAREQESMNET